VAWDRCVGEDVVPEIGGEGEDVCTIGEGGRAGVMTTFSTSCRTGSLSYDGEDLTKLVVVNKLGRESEEGRFRVETIVALSGITGSTIDPTGRVTTLLLFPVIESSKERFSP
jgi:hypothetical protein